MTNVKLSPAWELALLSLREAHTQTPTHVSVHEVPTSKGVAPFTAAIGGETALYVVAETPAVGRLVLLSDPQKQPGWGGQFRVVVLVASETELDLGEDPPAGGVARSWLRDALTGREAHYSHLISTTTATINRSSSGGSLRDTSASLEIHASWTPTSHDLSVHFLAWVDILLQSTGFSPEENMVGLRSL